MFVTFGPSSKKEAERPPHHLRSPFYFELKDLLAEVVPIVGEAKSLDEMIAKTIDCCASKKPHDDWHKLRALNWKALVRDLQNKIGAGLKRLSFSPEVDEVLIYAQGPDCEEEQRPFWVNIEGTVGRLSGRFVVPLRTDGNHTVANDVALFQALSDISQVDGNSLGCFCEGPLMYGTVYWAVRESCERWSSLIFQENWVDKAKAVLGVGPKARARIVCAGFADTVAFVGVATGERFDETSDFRSIVKEYGNATIVNSVDELVVPKSMRFEMGCFASDGGSIMLFGSDERGMSHSLNSVQHSYLEGDYDQIPGRLYFNGVLVPLQSEIEQDLVKMLKVAKIVPGEHEGKAIASALQEIIQYVESGEILAVAEKLCKLAIKSKLYFVAPGPNKLKAMSHMRTMLGLGLKEAKAFVEGPKALVAEGNKVEVDEVRATLEKLGIVVEQVDE